jgi:hypothetical protein
MNANPALKPKVATPLLIVASAATILFAAVMPTLRPGSILLQWMLVAVALGGLVIILFWVHRVHRQRGWQASADSRWNALERAKRDHGTTTEITVLSVDGLQPTGSWITIRWNRFDHVQPAWIEALPEPIWPGSVLLISPDHAQVRPGSPWPATYRITGDRVLAWAPLV